MLPPPRQRTAPQATGLAGGCAYIFGWLAVLGGGAWAGLTVMFMGLDSPESTLTLLIAAPGALVALVGLGMVLLCAGSST